MAAGVMPLLGFAQKRPSHTEMIRPIAGRHRKRAHWIQHTTCAANTLVELAVSHDQPLRIRPVRRRRDTDEIERKHDAFVRKPKQGRAASVREHRIVGGAPERTQIIAVQLGNDIARDLQRVAARQIGQEPGMRIEPLAIRPQDFSSLANAFASSPKVRSETVSRLSTRPASKAPSSGGIVPS